MAATSPVVSRGAALSAELDEMATAVESRNAANAGYRREVWRRGFVDGDGGGKVGGSPTPRLLLQIVTPATEAFWHQDRAGLDNTTNPQTKINMLAVQFGL